MTKFLRPYQQSALDNLLSRLKQTKHPLLVNASVGSGKSLIIAELLLIMERANMRALCLTLNSTLIQQNHDAYQNQGGNPGVYCAGLNAKDCYQSVVFASPHSVVQGIKNNKDIGKQEFKLVVVDECHNINPHNNDTMFQRILNHYGQMAQEKQYSYRIVGLTGTPYRGKGDSIVGPNQLFKEEVCNITTSWLISQNYLVKPEFGLPKTESFDFSKLRVNNMGQYNGRELQAVIDKNERLTGEIMREVVSVIDGGRNGAFIFASTIKHCYECARALPAGKWAIITGDTPHEERKKILEKARNRDCKYLISVNCLNVGVDVPLFDTAVWVRPTESLILYTQGIGRVLRLHPGKSSAVILDYSGNLERHGDIDDPIINEALRPNESNEKDYIIPCYTCGTNNTLHARRCIGIMADKRCDHFFQFKDCHNCGIPNDITSRACRSCDQELIDPNAKLRKVRETYSFNVIKAEYWVSTIGSGSFPSIHVRYFTQEREIFESFLTNSEKAKNITYAKFVRLHVPSPSEFYMDLRNLERVKYMINERELYTPYEIVCTKDEYGRYSVMKKLFHPVE